MHRLAHHGIEVHRKQHFQFRMERGDIGDGIAETAMVAFMTKMTGRGHTLTHYALMYSVAALTGKFLKGFSGLLIDSLKPSIGLFPAYAAFFAFTAALALPTLFLCWRLRLSGVFTKR